MIIVIIVSMEEMILYTQVSLYENDTCHIGEKTIYFKKEIVIYLK